MAAAAQPLVAEARQLAAAMPAEPPRRRRRQAAVEGLVFPRAPGYLNSRLLGHKTIGYIEARTQYLGTWSPSVWFGVQFRVWGSYVPSRSQNTIALISRTPKKAPVILGMFRRD